MTAPDRYETYEAIARATGVAINASVSVRTAKRWGRAASPGGRPRLPVLVYPNGRAYLLAADLALFAASWKALRPSGGRVPGRTVARESEAA